MLTRLLKRFWRGTVPENYQRGRDAAGTIIAASHNKHADAAQLYRLASGGFDLCPELKAFDRGIIDRLDELGFKEGP